MMEMLSTCTPPAGAPGLSSGKGEQSYISHGGEAGLAEVTMRLMASWAKWSDQLHPMRMPRTQGYTTSWSVHAVQVGIPHLAQVVPHAADVQNCLRVVDAKPLRQAVHGEVPEANGDVGLVPCDVPASDLADPAVK